MVTIAMSLTVTQGIPMALSIANRSHFEVPYPDGMVTGRKIGEWVASLLVQLTSLACITETTQTSDGTATTGAGILSAGSALERLDLELEYLNGFMQAFSRQASDV
jgi:hypothetical protein